MSASPRLWEKLLPDSDYCLFPFLEPGLSSWFTRVVCSFSTCCHTEWSFSVSSVSESHLWIWLLRTGPNYLYPYLPGSKFYHKKRQQPLKNSDLFFIGYFSSMLMMAILYFLDRLVPWIFEVSREFIPLKRWDWRQVRCQRLCSVHGTKPISKPIGGCGRLSSPLPPLI